MGAKSVLCSGVWLCVGGGVGLLVLEVYFLSLNSTLETAKHAVYNVRKQS